MKLIICRLLAHGPFDPYELKIQAIGVQFGGFVFGRSLAPLARLRVAGRAFEGERAGTRVYGNVTLAPLAASPLDVLIHGSDLKRQVLAGDCGADLEQVSRRT